MKLADIRHMKLGYLLGVLMCAVGAISLFSAIGDGRDSMYIFSKVLLILFGLFMILDPKKNNMRAIGLYALAIGSGRLLRGLSDATAESDAVFATGMIMIALGGSLMICGYNYFKGISKNAYMMTMIAYVILMAYVLIIIYGIYVGADIWTYILDNSDMVSFIIMYAVYILVLTSPEVTCNMPMERILRSIDDIRSVSGISGDLGITSSDLSEITNGLNGTPSWSAVADGPVEYETSIKLSGTDNTFMVLQKWKGEKPIYITMSADPDGTLIQASRFTVTDIVPENGTMEECDHIRLYGPDGMVARLKIKDRQRCE